MARTLTEIEEQIENEAATFPKLEALQSNTSNVAFWSYSKKIVAFVALTIEKMLDQHKLDVTQMVDQTAMGSLEWYLNVCYSFQYGDSLVIVNNRPVYASIDESKQIIKRVSIKEREDLALHIKAVKEINGELVPLEVNEKASFIAYINRRKIVGTKIVIESLEADLLYLQVEVLLDPLLFDSEGSLISDGSMPVQEKIESHIKTFDFGGVFYLSKLITKVLKIDGVKDFFITSSKLNGADFTQKIESPAGYIKLDSNTQTTYVLS